MLTVSFAVLIASVPLAALHATWLVAQVAFA